MPLQKKISRLIRRRRRVSILAEHGLGILAKTKNGMFVVEAGDFSVGRTLLQKGEYDFDEIQWLKKCLGEHPQHIVIVGTHIGTLLIPLAGSCTEVLGFEADKTNFELLNINMTLNKINNAVVQNIAIGNKKQIVNVKRNILNTGNTSVAISVETSDHNIEMTTLDDVINYDAIDLMVIDIEGHELHALKGASNTIQKTDKLYIEFAPEQLREHNTDPKEILEFLSQHFKYMYIYGENIDGYSVITGNSMVIDQMNGKGYLKNILYTKNKLSDEMLQD